jgi:uncharacterized membrane-anchored protein YjiN (DUF445 family)
VRQLVEELQQSAAYREKGEQLKEELLANKMLIEYSERLWTELRDHLSARLTEPDAAWQARLQHFISDLLTAVEADRALAAKLNGWMRELASGLVDAHRNRIGALVESTVNGWDAESLSAKIEREVGADLQFIRINGTLIGGAVGLLIHAIKLWLSRIF